MTTTKEEFTKLLENHKWNWSKYDDPIKYREGESQRNHINRLKKDNPELQKIFDDYIFVKFGR